MSNITQNTAKAQNSKTYEENLGNPAEGTKFTVTAPFHADLSAWGELNNENPVTLDHLRASYCTALQKYFEDSEPTLVKENDRWFPEYAKFAKGSLIFIKDEADPAKCSITVEINGETKDLGSCHNLAIGNSNVFELTREAAVENANISALAGFKPIQYHCVLIGKDGLQHENLFRTCRNDETPYDMVKSLEAVEWPGKNEDRFSKWQVCDVTDGFNDGHGHYTDGGYYAEQAKVKAEAKTDQARQQHQQKEKAKAKIKAQSKTRKSAALKGPRM